MIFISLKKKTNMIIKIYKNFIDVFKNKGWEDHTRFLKQGKNLIFISGNTLTKEEFLQIKKDYCHVYTNSKR